MFLIVFLLNQLNLIHFYFGIFFVIRFFYNYYYYFSKFLLFILILYSVGFTKDIFYIDYSFRKLFIIWNWIYKISVINFYFFRINSILAQLIILENKISFGLYLLHPGLEVFVFLCLINNVHYDKKSYYSLLIVFFIPFIFIVFVENMSL